MLTPYRRVWWPLLALFVCLVIDHPNAHAFPAGADNFENATAIPLIQTGVSESTTLTNFTAQALEPHHGFSESGPFHSAWWQWSTNTPGLCTVDTLFSAQLPDCVLDTQLSVYQFVNGQLVPIARNEDSGDSWLSSATFYALPGTIYYIAVDCPSAATGSAVLRLRELVPQDAAWSGIIQPRIFGSSPCGGITVRTTRFGTLTGKLQISGKSYPFKGAWGVDGRFRIAFPFPLIPGQPLLPPLDLWIDGAETKGGLLVQLTDGLERFEGEIGRVISYSKLSHAADAGTYNISLGEDTSGTPLMGFGAIRLTVSPMGITKGVGFLGDGQAIAFASPLITSRLDGVSMAPVHLPLFKGKGFLNGYVYAARSLVPAEGGVINMVYRRPDNASSTYYMSGFQAAIKGVGTLYEKPFPGQRVYGLFEPNGQGLFVVQTAPNEVDGFSASAVLSTSNAFRFPSVPDLVTVKLDPATGWVSGRAFDREHQLRTLRGIAVKFGSTALIRGFASGTTRTAQFGIVPQ